MPRILRRLVGRAELARFGREDKDEAAQVHGGGRTLRVGCLAGRKKSRVPISRAGHIWVAVAVEGYEALRLQVHANNGHTCSQDWTQGRSGEGRSLRAVWD